MTDHELKIWPEFYWALQAGIKRYEVRSTDRAFMLGQSILFREWSPTAKEYTGQHLIGRITYITPAGTMGLPINLCVFGVELVE